MPTPDHAQPTASVALPSPSDSSRQLSPDTDPVPNQDVYGSNGTNEAHTPAPAVDPAPHPAPNTLPPLAPYTPRQRMSPLRRLLVFFGYGRNNKARKELVSVLWTFVVDIAEVSVLPSIFVTIIVLLAYGAHHRSPTSPTQNEWEACGKPLGVWNALWIGRLVVDMWLSYYHWSKQRQKRLQTTTGDMVIGESGIPRIVNSGMGPHPRSMSQIGAAGSNTFQNQPNTPTRYPRWYGRLSFMCSTFTVVWFLLAHIFAYTSTTTCLKSSPHIWWLTFAILCVMYIVIVEVLLIALVVFIVGPLFVLCYSIILLIMGRHPMQNPHYINPEIGKLSRSIVESIPLVIYIPPPPDEPSGPITLPPGVYAYPPKPQTSSPPRRRFRFLRLKTKPKVTKDGVVTEDAKDTDRPPAWEDNWEKSEYPFVRLEGNRAACAICLMDFEEPKRVDGEGKEDITVEDKDEVGNVKRVTSHTHVHGVGDASRVRLEDAGEGSQPLRLLACGHVFHKTCVDPWLIDVSGRCPVCQRPVVVPPEPPMKKRRRGGDAPRTP
ncbi:hypothetical protein OF83DRAFT_1282114 [Amylostereum chailletii]|nr:hypothetical protein OF83DRAFT_1282114 [Amylostereum chailletii]